MLSFTSTQLIKKRKSWQREGRREKKEKKREKKEGREKRKRFHSIIPSLTYCPAVECKEERKEKEGVKRKKGPSILCPFLLFFLSKGKRV